MRFLHLADLHIGKRINEVSMLEDQQYVLAQVLDIIEREKAEGIIIAGDVYDKTIPSPQAVNVFDEFLTKLVRMQKKIYIISGNHDSGARLNFGHEIMSHNQVYVAGVLKETPLVIEEEDQYGKLYIHLLPFVKPATVKGIYGEEADRISTYTEAVSVCIQHMNMDKTRRNILIAHQFVTGAVKDGSEEISAGGIDNVEADVFSDFDYVALGHIHRAQKVVQENIRYSGTLLKYSLSEEKHKKSVTIVDIKEKGDVEVHTVEITPLRDLRQIRGDYNTLVQKSFYEETNTEDYLYAVLTDEEEVMDAMAKLKVIYPNLMSIRYDNTRTRAENTIEGAQEVIQKTDIELCSELYQLQNNQEMSAWQENYIKELLEGLTEE